MKGRPSAYHYNTYYTDEQGSRFYNDGSEFAGLGLRFQQFTRPATLR